MIVQCRSGFTTVLKWTSSILSDERFVQVSARWRRAALWRFLQANRFTWGNKRVWPQPKRNDKKLASMKRRSWKTDLPWWDGLAGQTVGEKRTLEHKCTCNGGIDKTNTPIHVTLIFHNCLQLTCNPRGEMNHSLNWDNPCSQGQVYKAWKIN